MITIYPIGSIYISETDSTVKSVQNRFGGTWVAYESGKTLVGSGTGTDANGTTKTFSVSNNSSNLGEYTHKLTVSEMPSHIHNDGTGTVAFAYPDDGGFSTQVTFDASLGRSTTATGGEDYHNNVQPYVTVYMYKRTA